MKLSMSGTGTWQRVARCIALALLAAVVAGCGNSGGSSSNSSVRVFNAVVDAGPITVTVGSKTAVSGLGFEGLTTYQQVDGGSQEFKVTVPGGTSPIIDTTFNLSGDSVYSYLVYGTASAPTAQLIL